MKPNLTRGKTGPAISPDATSKQSGPTDARDLLDAIEKGKARLANVKSECEALKSANVQLEKKIKRSKDQAQQMEETLKAAQAQRPSQEVKLPKIGSEPNLGPSKGQPGLQKSKSSASLGKLPKSGAPSKGAPIQHSATMQTSEEQSRPKRERGGPTDIEMKRFHLQEEHREQLSTALKAKQAVEEAQEQQIMQLEKERDRHLETAEELKCYLIKNAPSPAILDFAMRIKVAAQKIREQTRFELLENNFKETEKHAKRVRLALEGVYQDSEAIKERIATIEAAQSDMEKEKNNAKAIRKRMEKIWREREGKLEAALEKEKEARDQEFNRTRELLAYAAQCKSELAAAKKELMERQGVTLAWKRGFEDLWRGAQELRKEHENMKSTIQQRLVTEMAELQQRSAALLALLSVILPLTDQLRDLVESPVGAYIQNRVDMSSPLIDMDKLQRQLLELDSLRKKCGELNFSETKADMVTH